MTSANISGEIRLVSKNCWFPLLTSYCFCLEIFRVFTCGVGKLHCKKHKYWTVVDTSMNAFLFLQVLDIGLVALIRVGATESTNNSLLQLWVNHQGTSIITENLLNRSLWKHFLWTNLAALKMCMSFNFWSKTIVCLYWTSCGNRVSSKPQNLGFAFYFNCSQELSCTALLDFAKTNITIREFNISAHLHILNHMI